MLFRRIYLIPVHIYVTHLQCCALWRDRWERRSVERWLVTIRLHSFSKFFDKDRDIKMVLYHSDKTMNSLLNVIKIGTTRGSFYLHSAKKSVLPWLWAALWESSYGYLSIRPVTYAFLQYREGRLSDIEIFAKYELLVSNYSSPLQTGKVFRSRLTSLQLYHMHFKMTYIFYTKRQDAATSRRSRV